MNSKIILFFTGLFLFGFSGFVFAYQTNIIYWSQGNTQINNPETLQNFYDKLSGKPRDYLINSAKDFILDLNLLVPEAVNNNGRYSVKVFHDQVQIAQANGDSASWNELYDSFGRDYYLQGPKFSEKMAPGKYTIEVYSDNLPAQAGNSGEYVLQIGQQEVYAWPEVFNTFWQIPFLKLEFLKTDVMQFFLTPIGIGGIAAFGAFIILIVLLYYIVDLIKQAIEHSHAKTLLLTSAGMAMKDEIQKLLQKPAYDITVAFISTAAKPEENLDYLKEDWRIMKEELRFNVEEIDIEGKTEQQVMKMLELKDIIFVEDGNTFYLLKAMRACNFEKVIRKLLKKGKVYIGASAGSIVAGKTIKTADKFGMGKRNHFRVKNLKGLNLVNFDIFPHYKPELAQIIKKKMPFKWQRRKLKILTDDQAILVQGKEVDLIGKGEKIII